MSVPRSEIGALHPREDAVHVSVTREHALGRGQGVHGPGPLPTELGDPALSDRCQHCRILCAAARAATAGAIGVTVVAERLALLLGAGAEVLDTLLLLPLGLPRDGLLQDAQRPRLQLVLQAVVDACEEVDDRLSGVQVALEDRHSSDGARLGRGGPGLSARLLRR